MITDDNCMGHCTCPECGGPAYWAFQAKMHACADPDCGALFTRHEEEKRCGGCGDLHCRCDG